MQNLSTFRRGVFVVIGTIGHAFRLSYMYDELLQINFRLNMTTLVIVGLTRLLLSIISLTKNQR